MGLAENIRFFREMRNMYQSDLGQILGVSAQAVSKWELGKAEPDQDCIVKMCRLFGITSDQLFGLEPRKRKPETFGAIPKTPEARIVSTGMDRMPQEKREMLLSVILAMFKTDHPEYFTQEEGAPHDAGL